MTHAVGLAVTLRIRFGLCCADRPDGCVDPSRIFSLFSDVAAELMIRLDGDEGVLRGYQQLEVLGPVFAGDYVEATGVVTRVSNTTRQIAFEARRVVSYARAGNLAASAADALIDPAVVCRAVGTAIVPRALQRRPKIVAPALPAPVDGSRLPEGHVMVTPPPHAIITPMRSTSPEIIVAASIVGGGVTRDHTPHIPVLPEEIAEEARRCRNAGASCVYVGLDPTSVSSVEQLASRARQVVDAVRAASDVVVILSAISAGAVSAEVPSALAEAGADLVSLAAGSCNLGDGWIESPRKTIRQAAAALRERGTHVICDCLELGHVDEAVALAREKFLPHPVRVQVVLGVPGALGANDDVVRFLATRVPRGALWFAAGVGRHQRPVTEVAARSGGHIRVGLADNIYLKRGVLAEGSAPLVDRAASFARTLGRDPVDPARARSVLRLDAADAAAQPPAVEASAPPQALDPAASSDPPAQDPAPAPCPPDDKTEPSS